MTPSKRLVNADISGIMDGKKKNSSTNYNKFKIHYQNKRSEQFRLQAINDLNSSAIADIKNELFHDHFAKRNSVGSQSTSQS